MVSHCGLQLHIPKYSGMERVFVFLFNIYTFSLVTCLFKLFVLFNGAICFLIIRFWEFFLYPVYKALSHTWFINFSPNQWVAFSPFLIVFFDAQKFLILMQCQLLTFASYPFEIITKSSATKLSPNVFFQEFYGFRYLFHFKVIFVYAIK